MWRSLLFVAVLLSTQVSAQEEASITAVWEPAGLRVVWSAQESGCLVLVGGGLRDARLADVPCAASGDVVLGAGGDYLLTPVGRAHVELRAQSDLTRMVGRAEVPGRYTVVLPIVVKE